VALRYDGHTMKRVLGGIVALSFVTLLVVACDDTSGGGPYIPSSGGNYVCQAYGSCGSCTAVVGCGWCTDPNGHGVCASDPDSCPSSAFSWNWNPNECITPADASVGAFDAAPASDAGLLQGDARTDATGDAVAPASDATADGPSADGPSADAGTDDGASDASDAASSGDGCAVNAGTLCMAAAPFGLTCTTTHPFEASIPTPDPSLGCTIQPVPTSVGSAYFCCVSAP
jgi:hypothetical protein